MDNHIRRKILELLYIQGRRCASYVKIDSLIKGIDEIEHPDLLYHIDYLENKGYIQTKNIDDGFIITRKVILTIQGSNLIENEDAMSEKMINLVKSPHELAKMIDHTNLKPDATLNDIEKLCMEAKTYEFASVCVNPSNVNFAAELLKNEDIEVCTVIGFPLGANTSRIKSLETKEAVRNGATEVDVVMNIGSFKSGFDFKVKDEIEEVIAVSNGNIVKVIIETGSLKSNEIIKAVEIVKESGADFVKTSTGVNYPGAKVEDIELIKKTIGSSPLKIKASGGIRDLKSTLEMIKAGAARIGTSSGVGIIKEAGLLKPSD